MKIFNDLVNFTELRHSHFLSLWTANGQYRMGYPNGLPEWATRMNHSNGLSEWLIRMGYSEWADRKAYSIIYRKRKPMSYRLN